MNTKPVPQHFFKAPLFGRGVGVRCILAAAILLCGCQPNNSDDPDEPFYPLQINVENGTRYNALIDTVKAVTDYGYLVASAPYGNGTFTLNLPATLPVKELDPIDFIMPPWATISDSSVMATILYIKTFRQSKPAGSITLITCSPAEFETVTDGTTGIYIYVDRNVDITASIEAENGNETYPVNMALHFKQGWNQMYAIWKIETENILEPDGSGGETITTRTVQYIHTVTTTPSDGIKWYYIDNYFTIKSGNGTAKSTMHHQQLFTFAEYISKLPLLN